MKLKVKKNNTKPEKILLAEDLYILWKDGTESHISFFKLRDFCPCASCIDEITGEKTLDTNSIPKDIHPLSSEYVGNYALRIQWSDKHDTGIYHFKMLQSLS